MVRPCKPGVDWVAIREAYLEGATSLKAIAKLHNLSRAGISKRAVKEGWHRNPPPPKVYNRAPSPLLPRLTKASVAAQGDDRTKESIVQSLAKGLTVRLAAMAVGVVPATIKLWQREDPAFLEACDQACAEYIASRVGNIKAAGDRGDWKADQFLIERHPLSREDYGAPRTGNHGPQIQVILNVPAPGSNDPVEVKGEVIDG